MSNISLTNTFTDILPADPELANFPRQVQNACYSWVKPKGMTNPQMIIFSEELAHDLDIPLDFCKSQTFT